MHININSANVKAPDSDDDLAPGDAAVDHDLAPGDASSSVHAIEGPAVDHIPIGGTVTPPARAPGGVVFKP